ncbi:hypothetical protein AHF37_00885 [Paragonimus kellicotti]|nr:hypothetical protein AHF37_00885 [Paragonimus kellicotti]
MSHKLVNSTVKEVAQLNILYVIPSNNIRPMFQSARFTSFNLNSVIWCFILSCFTTDEFMKNVLKEISNMEDMILELNKSIKDKEGALRLAGTRIDLRQDRPNVELCRDPANYR